jgi:hypothetical protein
VQLKETGALELIRAYSAIRSAGRRRIVVSLAQTLAKEDEPEVADLAL